MPIVLVRQTVPDVGHWTAVFAEDRDLRRANGECGEQTWHSAANPNEIWLMLAWDDPFRARLFARSEHLAEAWRRAGVTQPAEVWVLDEG